MLAGFPDAYRNAFLAIDRPFEELPLITVDTKEDGFGVSVVMRYCDVSGVLF